jgi:hypothetical protein
VGTRRGDAPGTRAGRDRGRGRGDAPARRRVCRLSGLSRGSPCPALLEEGEREERRPQRLRVAPELPVLDQRPPDEPSEAGRVLRVGGNRHAWTKGQAGGTARGDESLGVASPPLPRQKKRWYRTVMTVVANLTSIPSESHSFFAFITTREPPRSPFLQRAVERSATQTSSWAANPLGECPGHRLLARAWTRGRRARSPAPIPVSGRSRLV